LAKALGADWSPVVDVGDAVVRVRFERCDLNFVVVPGGRMTMGMAEAELAELGELGDEVAESVEFLAGLAAPAHPVAVEPFLCAETPLLTRHAAMLSIEGDYANAHGVLRQDSWHAAAGVAACGLRLLSEAEWEWIARDGGRQSWLCGEERPDVWTERILANDPNAARTPLGTLMLGWGEWVDDGWHDDYLGAPSGSRPWEPVDRPETVRGGALACWPWQGGGEAVLLHATARERGAGQAIHAVRLAADLPPR
jgi:formylglycine-generating enzyme required for sulfatase activity